MDEQQGIGFITQAATAFNAGDFPRVLDAWASDVVWKVPGSSSMARTYTGRDELATFFAGAGEKSGGTLKLELEKVMANGDKSVHFMRITAERDSQPYSFTVATFAEHGSDSRPRRVWFMPDDLAAMDRLLA